MKAAGKYAPDDEPITYQQIVEAVGIQDALWCCRAEQQYSREWRLFAVWCARQFQHLMSDQRCIDALDVAERYAYGQATDGELEAAGAAASDAAGDATWAATAVAAAGDAAWAAGWTATPWAAASDDQRAAFIQLVTTGKLPTLTKL